MNVSLHFVDLAVLVAYLVAVVLFGLWVGRGQRDMSNYLLGGRDLPWWAILGSIVATETSTATFLSVPGLAFSEGGDLRFLQLAIGYLVGRFLIVLIFLPQYFRGELYTAYEVLHRRFGGATKCTASVVFLVARNLGDGLRLFLTAIVLDKVVGLSLPLCVVVIGVLTIIYTFFGGMKSVVWNDCVQFVVYMAGGVLAGVVILDRLPGGWEQYLAFGEQHDKFRLFDFQWDLSVTFTFWAGLVGGMFLTLGTHGTDQMMVQRYLCARSERDAGRALMMSGVVVMLQFALFLFLGVGLAAFYSEFAPKQPFDSADQVFATFIVAELPAGVGIIGITLAAVFSAAMSTLSSSLNSSATAAVNDLYLPLRRSKLSEMHQVWISRFLTVIFGVVQIVVGIAGMYVAESVVKNVLAIAGFTAGLLLGVFALGVFTNHVRQRAALIGLLTGVAVLTIVKFFTPIAWPWWALIGALTTFLTGLLIQSLFPQTVSEPAL